VVAIIPVTRLKANNHTGEHKCNWEELKAEGACISHIAGVVEDRVRYLKVRSKYEKPHDGSEAVRYDNRKERSAPSPLVSRCFGELSTGLAIYSPSQRDSYYVHP
jgi:hypothetical protein